MTLKSIAGGILNKFSRMVIRNKYPLDFEKDFIESYERCMPYTMTSIERAYALYKATLYIIENKIAGDIVECGIWKGGSTMLSIYCLLENNETNRKVYLYDTFEGMSKPTAKDISFQGEAAGAIWYRRWRKGRSDWCYSSLEEVKRNLHAVGYPQEKLIFVKGKVEKTIPLVIPERIALLRLDTDWYESTYHELKHLYPRLNRRGIIIIDDYGHWKGAREAVDKYFSEEKINIFMHRIDYTGRIGIKT